MSKSGAEAFVLANNLTGTQAGVSTPILGGSYALAVAGTPGTSELDVLDVNGNWIKVATIAAGYSVVQLPPGQVRLNVSVAATGLTVTLAQIPT